MNGRISEEEKFLWKDIRDQLVILTENRGNISKQEIEEKLKCARKHIRAGAPLQEIWDEISGILDRELDATEIILWLPVVNLFLITPLDGGKGMRIEEYVESLMWKPEWTVDPRDRGISQDTHVWDLSERTQVVIYLYIEQDMIIEDMLPETVCREMMDTDDMLLGRAFRAMRTHDVEEVRKCFTLFAERNYDEEGIASVSDMITGFEERVKERESQSDDEEEQEVFSEPQKPVRRQTPKISRNAPCPCGSGLKYKNCCGKNA